MLSSSRALFLCSIVILGILFSGCSGEKVEDEKLLIISPHWEGVRYEFGWAFSQWMEEKYSRKVHVEWLDMGGTADDLKYILSQFQKYPNGIGIDLFFGGGVDPYLKLKEMGLLERIDLPDGVLSKIPDEIFGVPIYDRDRCWFGAALAGFGILYNKKVLEFVGLPEPKSWDSLTDSKLLGWIGAGDPRNSGSMHMMYEIILQGYGWEKGWQVLTQMAGNVRYFAKSSSQTAKDVASGEVAYGLAIDSYAWAEIARYGEDALGYVLPEGLTVINPDAIGVLKGAPHKELAEKFVEFVLTDGQRLWMLKRGSPGGPKQFQIQRMAVVPALYSELSTDCVVRVNPFEFKGGFEYDAEKGSKRWVLLNDLIGALLIDTHPELVRAWQALIERGDEKAQEEFLKIPVSEEEALQIADMWDNPAFRNERIAEWVSFAKRKYRLVVEMVGDEH